MGRRGCLVGCRGPGGCCDDPCEIYGGLVSVVSRLGMKFEKQEVCSSFWIQKQCDSPLVSRFPMSSSSVAQASIKIFQNPERHLRHATLPPAFLSRLGCKSTLTHPSTMLFRAPRAH